MDFQLAEKHGDVFSLRMGQVWIVVLNGFKVVREALVNQGDSVIDRPVQPLQIDIGNGVSEQGERQQHRADEDAGHRAAVCRTHFTDDSHINSSTCKHAFKWTMEKCTPPMNWRWACCLHSFCGKLISLPLLVFIRCHFNKGARVEAAEAFRSVNPPLLWIRQEVAGTSHSRWVFKLRQRDQEIWWYIVNTAHAHLIVHLMSMLCS